MTIPSLTSAFQALQNAFKIPAPAAVATAKPPVPSLSGYTPAPAAKPAVPVMSMAPNMSTPKGPVYAPPPVVPPAQNMSKIPPNMSTPKGPVYAPPPVIPTGGGNSQNSGALTPGQFGGDTGFSSSQKPAAPKIAAPAPSTYTPPVMPASSFATPAAATEAPTVGSNTGNQSGVSNYSPSVGGSPSTGSAGAAPGAGVSVADEAYKRYLESLTPSKEEDEAQKRLEDLTVASEKAYTDTQNQPIALPFITGQQAAQQRSSALLSMPLEQQLARLQAKRTAAGSISKAMLDREDKLRDDNKPVSVGAGSSLVDPKTGKPIYTAPSSSEFKAPTTMETEQGILQWDSTSGQWVTTGFSGTKAADKKAASQASAQAAEARAAGVEAKITEALGNINNWTAGVAGAASQNVPGTPAYNLARTIDVVKANLGFQELAAMRAQSPTGGALGNVTEKELQFLQSTVASLDIGQSPEQLKKNLEEIRTHFNTWKNAVVQAAQQSGGSSSSSSSAANEGWF